MYMCICMCLKLGQIPGSGLKKITQKGSSASTSADSSNHMKITEMPHNDMEPNNLQTNVYLHCEDYNVSNKHQHVQINVLTEIHAIVYVGPTLSTLARVLAEVST